MKKWILNIGLFTEPSYEIQSFTVVRIKVMVVFVRGPCSFVVGYEYFRTVQLVPS